AYAIYYRTGRFALPAAPAKALPVRGFHHTSQRLASMSYKLQVGLDAQKFYISRHRRAERSEHRRAFLRACLEWGWRWRAPYSTLRSVLDNSLVSPKSPAALPVVTSSWRRPLRRRPGWFGWWRRRGRRRRSRLRRRRGRSRCL